MNKLIEKFYVEEFLKCIDYPSIILEDSESPDFLIHHNNRTIGIEVTCLKKEGISEIAGIQRKIVKDAQQMAISNNLDPLDIHVWMYTKRYINGQSYINEASKFLYQTVIDNFELIRSSNGNIVTVHLEQNKYGIHQITAHWHTINGTRWLDDHRWQTQEPGLVSINFANILQREIDKKNNKINLYLNKCNSCWLVVVIDRSKKDEMFDYSYINKEISFLSKFEKTYFFDLMDRKAYLLNTY